MIAQTSISPYLTSPMSSYQVHSPSWMHHQSYLMQPMGTVIAPTMDHTMSLQPTSIMGPLTQQLNHLSLSNTGTVSAAYTANALGSWGKVRANRWPRPPGGVGGVGEWGVWGGFFFPDRNNPLSSHVSTSSRRRQVVCGTNTRTVKHLFVSACESVRV
uniref:Uncharacterized protein n=2 Tax=Callorhinchus milii TaxID=7868 RepID=A0A4W3GLV4_CALMI